VELDHIRAALARLADPGVPPVARFDATDALEGAMIVLPSAFNPPTFAHFRLLEVGLEATAATGAAALLTTRNVDKGLYGATLEHRVCMLLAAAERPPAPAVLATREARIADQARALRETYPRASFDFVAGYDTLVRLFAPRYYRGDMEPVLEEFFGHHRLVATNRGEAGPREVAKFLATRPAASFAERIIAAELDDHAAALSSTAAREALEAGDHAHALIDAVRAYVAEHGLYGAPPSGPG
jgi:nicotinamide-nucleotide adenylyltransferase